MGDKQLERAVYLAVSADAVNAVRDSVVVDPCTPFERAPRTVLEDLGYTGVLYGANGTNPEWIVALTCGTMFAGQHATPPVTITTPGATIVSGRTDEGVDFRQSSSKIVGSFIGPVCTFEALVVASTPTVSVGVAVGDEKWDLVAGGGDRAVVFAGTVLVRGAKLLEMLNQLAEKNAPDPFEVAHAAHLMDLSRRSDDVERRKALLLAAGVVWTTTFICASSKYAVPEDPRAAWVREIAVSTGRSMFSLDAPPPSISMRRQESCYPQCRRNEKG